MYELDVYFMSVYHAIMCVLQNTVNQSCILRVCNGYAKTLFRNVKCIEKHNEASHTTITTFMTRNV